MLHVRMTWHAFYTKFTKFFFHAAAAVSSDNCRGILVRVSSVKSLQSHFFTAVLLSSWTWSAVQTTCGGLLFYAWTLPLFSYSFSINLLFFLRSWSQRCFCFHNERGRRRSSSWDLGLRHHLFCFIILISKSVFPFSLCWPVSLCVSRWEEQEELIPTMDTWVRC